MPRVGELSGKHTIINFRPCVLNCCLHWKNTFLTLLFVSKVKRTTLRLGTRKPSVNVLALLVTYTVSVVFLFFCDLLKAWKPRSARDRAALLASSGQRPRMLLPTLQSTGQPSPRRDSPGPKEQQHWGWETPS